MIINVHIMIGYMHIICRCTLMIIMIIACCRYIHIMIIVCRYIS